jgi:uncharacterized protein DUF4136
MKMKSQPFVIAILAVLALSSCSTTKYTVDKDDSIDFSKYKTYQYYGWAEESNKILTPFDQERIEKAFGNELVKRGLKYEKETGDLIITLYIVTAEKTKTTATTTGMGMGGGYGYGGYRGYGPAYGWGPSMTSAHTTYSEYDYVVGTLIIDIYDAKGKKLIWESVAKGTINEKTKGREQRINSTAAKMMINYPVKPTKK